MRNASSLGPLSPWKGDEAAEHAHRYFLSAEPGFYVYSDRDKQAVRGPFGTAKMAFYRKARLWDRDWRLSVLEVVVMPKRVAA